MRRHRKSLWASGVLSMAAAVCCGLAFTAAAAVMSAALIYYVMGDMGLSGRLQAFPRGRCLYREPISTASTGAGKDFSGALSVELSCMSSLQRQG